MFKKIILAALLVFISCSTVFAASADFAEGRKAYDAKDWRNAIINLRPLVEAGDDRAMILIGNMYLEGLGVAKDPVEAFGLYRGAALKGNPDGMVATGTLYQIGSGVAEDNRIALGWFERAARLGNQAGAFLFAIHSYQGIKGKDFDIKPDFVRAYKWFRVAARGNVNTPMRKAAEVLATNLQKSITPEEKRAVDQELLTWKPEPGDTLGPIPDADFGKMPLISVPLEPVTP